MKSLYRVDILLKRCFIPGSLRPLSSGSWGRTSHRNKEVMIMGLLSIYCNWKSLPLIHDYSDYSENYSRSKEVYALMTSKKADCFMRFVEKKKH